MSAAITFGYLGSPASIVVEVTNSVLHTVPSGYFAIISAQVYGGTSIEINSTHALLSYTDTIGTDSIHTINSQMFVVPEGTTVELNGGTGTFTMALYAK